MALMVDDLLVVLLNPESGKAQCGISFGWAPVLAGALLWELAVDGRISPAAHGEPYRPNSVVVRRSDPPADWLLARTQDQIARGGASPVDSVTEKVADNLPADMVSRLEHAGWLRKEEKKKLGMVTSTLYFSLYPEYVNGLRRACWSALVDRQPADVRTTGMVSLAHAVDSADKLCPDADAAAVKARAAEIASTDWWIGPGIRKAAANLDAAASHRRDRRRR